MKKTIFKDAYTLAEILVTLLIIGVIAAITLPVLNGDIHNRTLEAQKKTFNSKFNDVLRLMQIKGALAKQYSSTEDFIDAMKNYANITKVCSSGELNQCFAPSILVTRSQVKYQTANLRKSDDIEANFSDAQLFGLIFADGSSAIIAYNNNCLIENTYDPLADLKACMALIYDANGSEGPNIINTDIGLINVSGNDSTGEKEYKVFYPGALSIAECESLIEQHPDYPIKGCAWENDTYAYSVKYCADLGMKLASLSDLQALAKEIYETEEISIEGTYDGEVKNQDLFKKIAGSKTSINVYSSYATSAHSIKGRQFSQNQTKTINYSSSATNAIGICVK